MLNEETGYKEHTIKEIKGYKLTKGPREIEIAHFQKKEQ